MKTFVQGFLLVLVFGIISVPGTVSAQLGSGVFGGGTDTAGNVQVPNEPSAVYLTEAAQRGGQNSGLLSGIFSGDGSLEDFINNLFSLSITIGGILAVAMLTYGGWRYMITTNPGQKTDARQRMLSAVLGLLMLLATWIILYQINPQLVALDFFSSTPSTNTGGNGAGGGAGSDSGGSGNGGAGGAGTSQFIDSYGSGSYADVLAAMSAAGGGFCYTDSSTYSYNCYLTFSSCEEAAGIGERCYSYSGTGVTIPAESTWSQNRGEYLLEESTDTDGTRVLRWQPNYYNYQPVSEARDAFKTACEAQEGWTFEDADIIPEPTYEYRCIPPTEPDTQTPDEGDGGNEGNEGEQPSPNIPDPRPTNSATPLPGQFCYETNPGLSEPYSCYQQAPRAPAPHDHAWAPGGLPGYYCYQGTIDGTAMYSCYTSAADCVAAAANTTCQLSTLERAPAAIQWSDRRMADNYCFDAGPNTYGCHTNEATCNEVAATNGTTCTLTPSSPLSNITRPQGNPFDQIPTNEPLLPMGDFSNLFPDDIDNDTDTPEAEPGTDAPFNPAAPAQEPRLGAAEPEQTSIIDRAVQAIRSVADSVSRIVQQIMSAIPFLGLQSSTPEPPDETGTGAIDNSFDQAASDTPAPTIPRTETPSTQDETARTYPIGSLGQGDRAAITAMFELFSQYQCGDPAGRNADTNVGCIELLGWIETAPSGLPAGHFVLWMPVEGGSSAGIASFAEICSRQFDGSLAVAPDTVEDVVSGGGFVTSTPYICDSK